MKPQKIIATLMLLGQTLFLCKAGAVCLDPVTGVSGYQRPLAAEVSAADAIVIGRVLAEKPLQEDPSDPEGITASGVKIKLVTRLKGRLPKIFVVRNENDSSRYAMSAGEEHLLFVSRTGGEPWVNSCGNSSKMPEGKALVKQIQSQLRSSK